MLTNKEQNKGQDKGQILVVTGFEQSMSRLSDCSIKPFYYWYIVYTCVPVSKNGHLIIRLTQTKFHLVRGNFVSEHISYIIQPWPNLIYGCIMGRQSVRNQNLVTMTLSLTFDHVDLYHIRASGHIKLVPRAYLEHWITKLVVLICLILNDGCLNKQTVSI